MKIVYVLIILTAFFGCKKEEQSSSKAEIVVAPKNLKTGNNEVKQLLKIDASDISTLQSFDVYEDHLYISIGNDIRKISLTKGTSEDLKLKAKLSEFYKSLNGTDYIYNVIKQKSGFSVSYFNLVVDLTNDGNLVNNYSQKKILYSNVSSSDGGFVCGYDGIKLLDKKFTVVDSMKYYFSDDFFIASENGVNYYDRNDQPLVEIKRDGSKIKIKKWPAINTIKELPDVDDFYVSYISDKFLIGFRYNDRKQLYLIDRATYTISRKIDLPYDFTPTEDALIAEEGQPNLKVLKRNNTFYLCGLTNDNKLILLGF